MVGQPEPAGDECDWGGGGRRGGRWSELNSLARQLRPSRPPRGGTRDHDGTQRSVAQKYEGQTWNSIELKKRKTAEAVAEKWKARQAKVERIKGENDEPSTQ